MSRLYEMESFKDDGKFFKDWKDGLEPDHKESLMPTWEFRLYLFSSVEE